MAEASGQFNVKVKSTSGGEKLVQVGTSEGAKISELKAAISQQANIPAQELRLIYKGQVLKDERTVGNYGECTYSSPKGFQLCMTSRDLIVHQLWQSSTFLQTALFAQRKQRCSLLRVCMRKELQRETVNSIGYLHHRNQAWEKKHSIVGDFWSVLQF